MPEGQVDKIHIEIEARLGKLKDGLKQAESLVNTSVKKMGSAALLKKAAGIAAILVATRIAMETINVAIDAWQLGMAAIAGDARKVRTEYENIADAILKIPLLGGTLKSIVFATANLFGVDTIEDVRAAAQRQELQTARLRDELKLTQSVQVQGKLLEALKEIDLVKREQITLEARLLAIENKRRDLLEQNRAKIERQQQDATKGELALLKIAESRVRVRVDEFIAIEKQQAIEKSRLRIISLRTDLTETFQTPLGAATFGAGGGFDISQPPTKQGQERQLSLLTESKELLSRLLSAVEEGALA